MQYRPGASPFDCDSLYIQGTRRLYVLNAYCSRQCLQRHEDHFYPYPARTLVRDSRFSHNGLWNDPSNSTAHF